MESIGVGPWIAIVVAAAAIGILVGYWLGTKLGGHNTEPMRELNREHKAYKDEVRDHFQMVSATMTRMVEDYREMYQHVAKGAEKLADMHHETVIEPPPKPEAITQDVHDSSGEFLRSDDQAKPAAKAQATSPGSPRQDADSQAPPTKERPQDAAIRAAAEDAAIKR